MRAASKVTHPILLTTRKEDGTTSRNNQIARSKALALAKSLRVESQISYIVGNDGYQEIPSGEDSVQNYLGPAIEIVLSSIRYMWFFVR